VGERIGIFTAEALRAQSREFLIQKYFDLCDLRVSAVKKNSKFASLLCDCSLLTGKGGPMGEFLLELWSFMKERKKFWLLPIIVCLVLLGSLVVFTSGSAVAPFIYTLF
jgi:hypothetical protein